jgi:hypothetical protein
MALLVNRVKEEIASELVHKLYSQITSVETLLRGEYYHRQHKSLPMLLFEVAETDEVASRRRALADRIRMLNRAHEILNEVRDYSITSSSSTAPAAPLTAPAGLGMGIPNTASVGPASSAYAYGTGTLPTGMSANVSAGASVVPQLARYETTAAAAIAAAGLQRNSPATVTVQ